MNDRLEYFTDREREIAAFERLLADNGKRLLVFRGMSGTGKSTLLAWLRANRCRDELNVVINLGVSVLRYFPEFVGAIADGYRESAPQAHARYREIHKSVISDLMKKKVEIEQQVCVTDHSSLGLSTQKIEATKLIEEKEKEAAHALIIALEDLARGANRGLLVFLDDYQETEGNEAFREWLWEVLFRRCPNLAFVAATREWRARESLRNDLILPDKLDHFSERDCGAFLQKRGVESESDRDSIYRFSSGHPLIADMAADLLLMAGEGERRLSMAGMNAKLERDGEEVRNPTAWVVERILERLGGDTAIRKAVEYACLLRWFNMDILRAMDGRLGEALTENDKLKLYSLSFVKREGADRCAAHDLVRRARISSLLDDRERLNGICEQAEACFLARFEKSKKSEDLAESLYFKFVTDPWKAIEKLEAEIKKHTWIPDKESWAGLTRILDGLEWREIGLPGLVKGRFHLAAGRWFYYGCRMETALLHLEKAKDELSSASDAIDNSDPEKAKTALVLANTLKAVGDVQQFRKETEAALASYEQALVIYRAVGSRLGEANTLRAVGDVQQFLDDRDAALASYKAALDIYRALEDRLGEANMLRAVGDVQQFRYETEAALASYKGALGLYRDVGSRLGEARTLYSKGKLHFSIDDEESAEKYLHEALDICERINSKSDVANACWMLFFLHAKKGEIEKGLQYGRRAVELGMEFAPDHPVTLERKADLERFLGS